MEPTSGKSSKHVDFHDKMCWFHEDWRNKMKGKGCQERDRLFRFSCCMCSLLTLLYFLPSLVTLSLGNSVARCQLNSWSHSMATNRTINFTGQHPSIPRWSCATRIIFCTSVFHGYRTLLNAAVHAGHKLRSADTTECRAVVTRCEDQQLVWYQNTRKFSPNPPIQNMNAK